MSTSTTAYRNNLSSSRSFTRKQIRTSSTTTANSILPSMTNDRTRYSIPTNRKLDSTPSVAEASPRNVQTSFKSPRPLPQISSSSALINATPTESSSKQPYTFSNPPREVQRQSVQNSKSFRQSRLRHRVSSAPDENSFQISPRSLFNQQKPLSANESLTPRSHEGNCDLPVLVTTSAVSDGRRREQEKLSLNDLIKKQERSKVPTAVQKRRIIFLFRRLPGSTSPLISPRQQLNISPLKADLPFNDVQQHEQKSVDENFHPSMDPSSDSPTNDPFHCLDQAEIADSKQLAAILANIQSSDEWIPLTANDGISPRHEVKRFDPTKYEYVAKNSFDTTTFKLSPRTLKPEEETAARSRFSQNYRYEMLSSANAKLPPLMASIVTENNNTIGSTTGLEKTFTFRLNSTSTMKKQHSQEETESFVATTDSENVQLCFDDILKCFYDPDTGTYYELTSS